MVDLHFVSIAPALQQLSGQFLENFRHKLTTLALKLREPFFLPVSLKARYEYAFLHIYIFKPFSTQIQAQDSNFFLIPGLHM